MRGICALFDLPPRIKTRNILFLATNVRIVYLVCGSSKSSFSVVAHEDVDGSGGHQHMVLNCCWNKSFQPHFLLAEHGRENQTVLVPYSS